MQYYFIGGLGGNSYHLAPLIEKLGFPVTFLDPYREMIQTENDLCAWFQGQIGQAEEICLLGAFLGWRFGSLSGCRVSSDSSSDSPGWGLSGYGKDPAS